MIRWEYKVASFAANAAKPDWDNQELKGCNLEEGLRELGYKGWELVSAGPVNIASKTESTVLIFKRPRN
ncbi:DUF4177 domain-containing protein [uncultured Sphingomonas sp.]|uniref:DUF4177 domain-containing protein n=1 Tax=uncultured Sphingomonas sp. TaxID=158754 RepID=UPI003456568D